MDYVIHHDTDNESFIKLFKTLKNKGIKNNKFFLRLYDPSLRDIDPFDEENLTDIQKVRILQEIINNPWYFLREIVKIPVPGGEVRYKIHRGNLSSSWSIFNNINFIQCLPRQNFKTISVICAFIWIYHFGTSNSEMSFSNKKYADSKLNIKRFNDIKDLLPSYLLFNSSKDTKNLAKLKYNKNNNTIVAIPSANSLERADNIGRGNTQPLQWYDEFAFLPYNGTIYTAAAPAQSQAMIEAKSNGRPYGKFMTTTPNNLDVPEGKYCKDMINQAAPFTEDFYDWTFDKIEEYIQNNSNNDFIYIEFSAKELGRDEKWLRSQKRALNNDTFKIKREIFIEWTYANDTSIFDEDQLIGIRNHVIEEPIGKIYLKKYFPLQIYKELKNWDKSWIIGVDVAGGLDRDNSAVVMIDPIDFSVVAEFRSNRISTTDLAEVLMEMVTMYFNNAVLIIERNNHGIGIIDLLLKKSNIVRNLYYEVRRKKGQKKIKKPSANTRSTTQIRRYGMDTGKTNRDEMFSEVLNYIVDEEPEKVVSPHIFSEIRTLERKKTGKIEHRDGENDDSLMAMLIARWVVGYGSNIERFLRKGSNYNDSEGFSGRKRIKTNMNSVIELNKENNDKFGYTKEIIEEEVRRKDLTQKIFDMNKSSDWGFNDEKDKY